MREILFRGQTRRFGEKVWMNGEKVPSNWVYGGIFQGTGDFSVIYGADKEDFTGSDLGKHTVYTDTVGQYTGLKDKNGKRIFEGDIVSFLWKMDEKTRNFFIEYSDGEFHATPLHPAKDIWSIRINGYGEKFNVIGNIHDNPELLEV